MASDTSEGSRGFAGVTWSERASYGVLRAVLDPADASGAKNAYIDAVHAAAVVPALRAGAPYARALDFGCGTGRFLGRLAQFAREVHGVDCTPEMLAVARERYPALRLEESAGYPLAYPERYFDLVLTVYVLSMYEAAGLRAALEEIARIAAPRARLISIEQLDNRRRLNESTYRTSFDRCGFAIERMVPVRDGSGSRWLTLGQRFPKAAPLFARGEIAHMRTKRHSAQTPYYVDYLIVARRA